MDKRTIIIVDDEKEITELLELYLKGEGFDIHKFYNGEDAWAFIQENEVDLALLDVMLPDMDGFTLCRKIRESYYFPIIMVTAKIDEADRVNGLLLGADDYITKPFYPLEVTARVKGQLRRAVQYNREMEVPEKDRDEVYLINGLEVNASSHTCVLYDEVLSLTPTEFDILLYLCRHMGQVVTGEELFEAVWKEKYLDSNNTVFVHIARIREKMHENARKPKFIKTVWGVGYKLEP